MTLPATFEIVGIVPSGNTGYEIQATIVVCPGVGELRRTIRWRLYKELQRAIDYAEALGYDHKDAADKATGGTT